MQKQNDIRMWTVACMVTLMAASRLLGLPTDNPVASYYDDASGYPSWTAGISWDNVIDMSTYGVGVNDFEKFEHARDVLYNQGGGVLYYPPGDYDFSSMPADGPGGRGLMLRTGVVIRGASPAGDRDASDGSLVLSTRFHFGFQSKGGGQVPRDWNIIGLMPSPGETLKDVDRVGIAWVHVDGGCVYFGPELTWGVSYGTSGGWKSPKVKSSWSGRVPDGTYYWDPFTGAEVGVAGYEGAGDGRLVFGCVFENAAMLNDAIDEGFGSNGFFMFKFGARVSVYGSNVLIANNLMPKSTMNFLYVQDTSAHTGSAVLFDYGLMHGVDVNKEYLNPFVNKAAGYFEPGVVIRDNWIFNHGRKGFNISGKWVTLTNNHNERIYLTETVPNDYGGDSGEPYELTLDGYNESQPGGAGDYSDNLSRAFDLGGGPLWIDGSYYNNTGSNPGNDGEGILCQSHGGTVIYSWAVTHNNGQSGYMAGYDVNHYGSLWAWNSNPGWIGSVKPDNSALYDFAVVDNSGGTVMYDNNGQADVLISCPGGSPSPPSGVTATSSGDHVVIDYTDTSGSEAGFRVDRRIDGGAWHTIAYRPRHSDGHVENPTSWHDYCSPCGVALVYRVVSVNCDDTDSGASSETASVTIPCGGDQRTPVHYDSVGPIDPNWENEYQVRLSHFAYSSDPWSIGSGNADTDEGKRTWPPLLAEMWKDRGTASAVQAWIDGKGNELLFSQWAGQFYKPFSCPGYTMYYLHYKDQLPGVQISQVNTMLYTTHCNGVPWGGSLCETGWEQMRRVDHHMDPIFEFTEYNSENFYWMSRLAGKLLAYDQGDTGQQAYFDGFVDNWIRALYHAGRVEWNSNNYWGYCFQPILVLYEYAPDDRTKSQAKAALDWMLLEAALHYIDGFQAGADVRAKSDAYLPFKGSVWPYTYLYFLGDGYFPSYAGSTTASVAELAAEKNLVGFSQHSTYRPPQVLLDIAHRQYPLPVEIQSAKPFYHLDQDNFSDWRGDTARSRRYEFETIYHDENYLLSSISTYRPDGTAEHVGGQSNFFSEQNLWRLGVKGNGGGARQVMGNTGNYTGYYSNSGPCGRDPYEEIGQYGNVMMRLIKAPSNNSLWVGVPKSAARQVEGERLFVDMGQGVYFACIPYNGGSPVSTSYNDSHQKYSWSFTSGSLGGVVMEVGTQSDHGSYNDFKGHINNQTSLNSPDVDQVAYVSSLGRTLKLEWQPTTTHLLADGSIWSPAGVPPRVWRDDIEVNFDTWDSYGVVSGSEIVSQPWGGGVLTLSNGGDRTIQIEVSSSDASVQYYEGSEDPGPQDPAAPSDLAANPVAYNLIELSWSDNSTDESGFIVQRKRNTGSADWIDIAVLGADVTSYTDTDELYGFVTYVYRVGAYN